MTTRAPGHLGSYVLAQPVRDYIRDTLMPARVGLPRIAQLAGVPYATLGHLVYGSPGSGRAPSWRIREGIAARVLAVTPSPAAPADSALVDATGTRRRAQALIAWGHTERRIVPLVPMERSRLGQVIRGQVTMVTARVDRGMRAAYDQLWDQPPRSATAQDRRIATLARARAKARGWPVPMAWDDDTIDDPATPVPTGWQRTAFWRGEDLAEEFAELAARHPARFTAPERVRSDVARRLGVSRTALDAALRRHPAPARPALERAA